MTDNTMRPPQNEKIDTSLTFQPLSQSGKFANYTPSLRAFRFSDGKVNYAIEVLPDLTTYLLIERASGWDNAHPDDVPLVSESDFDYAGADNQIEKLSALAIERANTLLKILQGGQVERAEAQTTREAILDELASRFKPHQGMDGITILNPRN